MKTSRLAHRANSCGDAYPRVFVSEISSGSLVRSITNATKRLSVAFCTWGIALSAVSSAITLSWNKNPEPDVNNYRLTYGTSPGNLNNEVNAGSNLSVSLDSLQAGTLYYFAVAAVNSSGQRSQPSAVISYQVPTDPGNTVYVIPTSGWSLKSVSSEETQGEDGASANAFDGNPDTFWHSRWSSAAQPPPHEIQIDLGSTRPVSGFRYLPRQDGDTNGNIGQYEFYVSADGSTWGLPVATGVFANSASEKQVLFTEKSGRFVRFRALSDASGKSFACVAELTILQNEPIEVPVNQTPVANAGSSSTLEDTPVSVSLSASDADGDSLSYVIVKQPSKGDLFGTAPNLTYTPAPNSNGSDSFTFRVNDGTVDSNTATVSISVTPVNDAPVAVSKSATTSEDSPVSIVLSGSDVEGSSLTYSIVSGPSKGSLSGSAANRTYTPNGGASGSDSFTYQAYDGSAYSNTATVSITINPVNHAPVAASDSVGTQEDTAVAITLSASDPDGNPLSYVVVTGPSKGGFTGTAPNLIYHPSTNFNGQDSFTFRANDGNLNSNIATVVISVSPVNDAPVAASKSATTTEGSPVAITLSAADVEGGPLGYAIVSGPGKGSLSGSAPNLTYTPNSGVSGSDSFTYRANDGSLNSNIATVSISILSVNHAPVANAGSAKTAEDGSVAIQLSASDSDGDSLTYVIVGQPLKGGLSGSGLNRTYTPNKDFNGSDSFTFRASDGSLNSNVATVSISVTAVNDAPVAASQSATTSKNKPVTIQLSASDPDGDSLTYIIVTPPSKGSLSGSTPNLTYTPNSGVSGSDSFTYRADDGSLNSNVATVSITISSVNQAPVAKSGSAKTAEDESVAIQLSASDPDGDSLTYAIVTPPSKGALSGSGKNRTYTPDKDVNGSDSFTFRVSDGTSESNVVTVAITVTSVNDAPVASPGSADAEGKTPTGIKLVASDKDGDSLSYTIVSAPSTGVLSGTAPNLTYTSSTGSTSPDSFTFRVSDGKLSSNVAMVSITKSKTNRAPNAKSKSLTTLEGDSVAAVLSADDADGDSLTYKIVKSPANGSLTGSAPNMTYVPAAEYSGPDSFSYQVNDGTVDSNVATVSITVTKKETEITNHPPVFVKSPMTFRSGKEKKKYAGQTLAKTAVDPDAGDKLVFSKVSGPGWLKVSGTGRLSGTPNPGSKGMNTFVVRVTDMAGESAEALLNINVLFARLPLPWSVKQLGGAKDNIASFAGGEFSLAGAGRLAGSKDAGCFTYQTLTGDGSIIARVRSVDRAADASRAGLMIRDSLAANSRHVFVGENGKGGMNWVSRKHTGGKAVSKSARKAGRGSTWLRIVRKGETITGYQRVSKSKWKRIGAITIDIHKNCYIGLFASGGNRKSSEAKFRNVKVKP